MKSIMQNKKECFYCGNVLELEEHHIFFGTANRKMSEKYGLKVWLCYEHHRGTNGVHFNILANKSLKKFAQVKFEITYGDREDFIRIFGRNYL